MPPVYLGSLGLDSAPSSVDDVCRLWRYADLARPGVERMTQRHEAHDTPAREAARMAAVRLWVWGSHHAVLSGVPGVLTHDNPRGWRAGPFDGVRARSLAMRDAVESLGLGMPRRPDSRPPTVLSRYLDAWVDNSGLPFDAYVYLAVRTWADRDPAGRFVHAYDRTGVPQSWIYAYAQGQRPDQGVGDARRWRRHAQALEARLVDQVAAEYAAAAHAIDLVRRWDASRQPLPPSAPATVPVALR